MVNEQAAILLPPEFPPAWAAGFGEDRQGLFAEIDLAGKALELRWIPPGEFLMGSPGSENGRDDDEVLREVTLTRGFWLGRTPVTQEQFEAVNGTNPSGFKGDSRPVENVSWNDCMEFIGKLNGKVAGLNAGLPTEAQWEYACRAGTQSAFNDGSDCTQPTGKDPALEKLGWFDENSEMETHEVARKAPNAWGLHDMHGNVWEWCRDWSGGYGAEKQVDPTGPKQGLFRVLRGGAYWGGARLCRSAYRNWSDPADRRDSIGFRLAAGLELSREEPGAERSGRALRGPRDEA